MYVVSNKVTLVTVNWCMVVWCAQNLHQDVTTSVDSQSMLCKASHSF